MAVNKKHWAKGKAVFNPTWMECRDVLAPKGFRFCIENKSYPRERSREPHFRGRIRLQLKDESGQPLNPEFKTRLDVMYFICENIPKLKGRQEMARRAAESVSDSAKSGGGGGGASKKGGGGGGGGKKKQEEVILLSLILSCVHQKSQKVKCLP